MSAWAVPGGTPVGGGGDAAGIRIDTIRQDILEWISDGRAEGLNLPPRLTYDTYVNQMTQVLARHAVVIGSVSTSEENMTQDLERKVVVDSSLKHVEDLFR